MTQRVILVAISLLFITACDNLVYSPDKENYVEIHPEPTPLHISWNQAQETIGVWDRVTIEYDVDIEVELFSLDVFLSINGDVVAEAKEGKPLVWDTTTLRDGLYEASLIATARSGTGSLAERLGAEKSITFNTEKSIWVDNGDMDQLKAPKFTLLENGSLKLNWESYTRPRFKGYSIIEKGICDEGCERVLIEAADSTTWIDLNYDGRDRTYAVDVVDMRRRGNGRGKEATFSTSISPTSILNITSQNNSETLVTWEKSKYPLSFFSYSIIDNFHPDHNPKVISEITNIEKTSTTFPTPFGTRYRFYLATISVSPLDSNGAFYIPSSTIPIDVSVGQTFGQDISKIRFLHYNKQNQNYLMYADETLYLLDGSTLNILDSQDVISLGTTLTMRFISYSEVRGEVVFADNYILKIHDMTTLELKKEIDLRNIYPDIDFPLASNLQLGDDGILWYSTGYKYYNSYRYTNGIGAINIDSEEKISGTHYDSGRTGLGSIHPNGELIIAYIEELWRDPGFFRYKNGSLEHVYSPLSAAAAGFLKDGTSYLGLSTSGPEYESIEVRKIEDNSLTWSMRFPDDHRGYTHNIEENHFSYVSESEGGLILRKLTDGSVIDIISYDKVSLDESYHVVNNLVWLNNGIYEWMDEL